MSEGKSDKKNVPVRGAKLETQRQETVHRHHMQVKWRKTVHDENARTIDASLRERTMIVGRVGLMMLEYGTGAWRVLDAMDRTARRMGLICTADIGLVSISYTCMEGERTCAVSLSIPTTGINTDKLRRLEQFVYEFRERGHQMTLKEVYDRLDAISTLKGNYRPIQVGFAAGFACFGFTFLLGGGLPEMIVALIGAMCGNWLRVNLIKRHISLVLNTVAGVSLACVASILSYRIGEAFGLSPSHEAGYICAMLFIIPGFPLITGNMDLVKSHMRSGLERMAYAIMIITIATFTGWIIAQAMGFHPQDFVAYPINSSTQVGLWLICSFLGVYGFSMMYNSPRKMAATAGIIGAIANTTRLVLVDYEGMTPAVGAFIGATMAGLMGALIRTKIHYPRISMTVPSIVIMVPGMFMYKAIYFFGTGDFDIGLGWLIKAIFIVLALPLGLVFARILTDKRFRRNY